MLIIKYVSNGIPM